MQQQPLLKGLLVAALGFGLSACSLFGSSDEELAVEPNPLPKFTEQVELDRLWSRSIGDGTDGQYALLQPVIVGEQIFASDINGRVEALNRHTGERLWAVDLEQPLGTGVGADYDSVLVGTLDGLVIALDSRDGSERWRARVSSEVLTAVQSSGLTALVLTNDQRLSALDMETGAILWTLENNQPVLTLRGSAAPLLTERVAFVGYANGEMRAVALDTGMVLWEQPVALPKGSSELEQMVDLQSQPVLDQGALFSVSYQGNLVALDPRSGRPYWRREASSYQGLDAAYGNLFMTDTEDYLSAVDMRSSTILWQQQELAGRRLSAPTVFDRYVAVGDFEGYLHLVDQQNGQFAGRYRVDSKGLRSKPLVVDGVLYAYGDGGNLVALELEQDR